MSVGDIYLHLVENAGAAALLLTCCETLELPLALRRMVSLWQAVSSELGRMERKSWKERRRAASKSSPTKSGVGHARGNSLDSSGSSVLL